MSFNLNLPHIKISTQKTSAQCRIFNYISALHYICIFFAYTLKVIFVFFFNSFVLIE